MSKYKRLLSVGLCVSILISSLIFDSIHAFGENKKGIVNGTDVWLRSEPNTAASTKIKKVNYPETVEIIATVSGTVAESGYGDKWYNVRISDGTLGYIYGRYITEINTGSSESFEEQLAKFPDSYKSLITALHNIYPNCRFEADILNIDFEEAVQIQFSKLNKKQVQSSKPDSWKSMQDGAYNWTTNTYTSNNGGWASAAKSVIAYYVDPRNFLNTDGMYMFLQQSYNPATQTEAMLRNTVKGTFLENGYGSDADAYIKDIIEAANKTGVSPLVLAATIIVEQGTGGNSALISGSSGYFNFFNIGASGSTKEDVINSGLNKAREKGWDTRRKSIIGGAETYADGYINKGQDTYYYKDFNYAVNYPSYIYHQYAQSIYDAYTNGSRLRRAYSTIPTATLSLVFRIPVFKNMPSSPVEKPAENTNKNNFYLTGMSTNGLSPGFSMYNQSYSLSVSGNTVIKLSVPEGASVVSQRTYNLSPGTQNIVITVQAQTGDTNNYTVRVTAQSACTLIATTDDTPIDLDPGPTPDPEVTTGKGDINKDGKIDIIDFAILRSYLLEITKLTSEQENAADVNGDGKADIIDFAMIRSHLLEINIIKW